MKTFFYALCWFVPLSGTAYVLSVFEIFPQQHHWLVGLVYIATVGLAVWRISLFAHKEGEKKKLKELYRQTMAGLDQAMPATRHEAHPITTGRVRDQ